jgi:hypothetical protein
MGRRENQRDARKRLLRPEQAIGYITREDKEKIYVSVQNGAKVRTHFK